MKLLGITGGVGMGKSTAQTLLVARSIPVIDTDELARAEVEPGQPALAEIVAHFGAEFLHEDGSLRRDALAKVVFNDPAARSRLESILHPRIRSRWSVKVQRWREDGVEVGAVVIPLLFETEGGSAFDATVCVTCSASTQLDRLKARGWAEEEIRQRVSAQWPVEQKMAASDYVVWTDGDLQTHALQWGKILRSMEGA